MGAVRPNNAGAAHHIYSLFSERSPDFFLSSCIALNFLLLLKCWFGNYICFHSFWVVGWRRETGVESVNDLNGIFLREKKKKDICNVGDFSLQLYVFVFFFLSILHCYYL